MELKRDTFDINLNADVTFNRTAYGIETTFSLIRMK